MSKICEDGGLGWRSGGPEARGKGNKGKKKTSEQGEKEERRRRGLAEEERRKWE